MKRLIHEHLAHAALAVELTTLGAVIIFMIAATVGMPSATVA